MALPIMIIGVTVLVFFSHGSFRPSTRHIRSWVKMLEAQVQQYREEHGLNDPVLVQYGSFMVGLVQGRPWHLWREQRFGCRRSWHPLCPSRFS